MTAQKFEVGQRVWVSVRNRLEPSKPYITEYVVLSVRRFIYAKPINHEYNIAFSKKDLIHVGGARTKYEYKLWAEVEDFWKAVEEGMYSGKS